MSRKFISTLNLPHDEWLKYRRTGIGGSDASTVVGLNPYNSRFRLYCDKMGLIESIPDTEIMRQGRDFEEYVARRFCEATGKKVRRRNYMFRHEDYDYILADIDREIVGENAGLECKTTSLFNKSDFENGEIPLTYYVQMMHYMAVMGYEKMYLAVLVLSKAFYWFEIERNEDEIQSLILSESDFWNNHVLTASPPETDGSDATIQAVKEVYGSNIDGLAVANVSNELMSRYENVKNLYDAAKMRLDAVKAEIQTTMGRCGKGSSENYKISWLPQSRSTVDSKKLKSRYPKVYEDCLNTTSSRVLRITKISTEE